LIVELNGGSSASSAVHADANGLSIAF